MLYILFHVAIIKYSQFSLLLISFTPFLHNKTVVAMRPFSLRILARAELRAKPERARLFEKINGATENRRFSKAEYLIFELPIIQDSEKPDGRSETSPVSECEVDDNEVKSTAATSTKVFQDSEKSYYAFTVS